MSALITEEEFARAKDDAQFRQRMMVEKLDLLLAEIARMRLDKPEPNSPTAKQIKEGVDLAVKLADILQKKAQADGTQAA
jgi:hypothetical protein